MKREKLGTIVYLKNEHVPPFHWGRPFVILGHTAMGCIVVPCTTTSRDLPDKLPVEIYGQKSYLKTTDHLTIGLNTISEVGYQIDPNVLAQARRIVQAEVTRAMMKGDTLGKLKTCFAEDGQSMAPGKNQDPKERSARASHPEKITQR